ncbi:hypothetical protein JYU12_01700 [bacterium AH-315-K03]|nr:hypothetical protein [bacterium AH-315-K03]
MSLLKIINKSLLIGAVLFSSTFSQANPERLSLWENWLIKEHKQQGCPWISGKKNTRQCIWPARLILNSNKHGMDFSLKLEVYGQKKSQVPLPGDQKNWPLSVSVNGQAAPMVEKNKQPYLSLSAGSYTIQGKFEWEKKPGQLRVPTAVALISLTHLGKTQTLNRRGQYIIFSNSTSTNPKQSRDSLGIEVYRKLIDGIPVLMESQIKLSVSGKAREVTLGKVLFANSSIVALSSPIPARVEPNGDMRVQLIPGEHIIHLATRFINNPEFIEIPQASSAHWPATETISFQADTQIRQAKLSGVTSIDTTQIPMPEEWTDLPSYQLDKNSKLLIETLTRGDHTPPANELKITRDLWLDFNGEGLTTLDQINGNMYQHWRLNGAPGSRIGRATVDEEAVLITEDNKQQGIEIRSASIALNAVTRVESTSTFSATGWLARAENYRATLHLPPGWRVFHASGVDQIAGTWISQWDLWDVFLMLIVVGATRKLLNKRSAVLAAASFILALHEPGTPLLLIPVLLLTIALLPLAGGKIKTLLTTTGVLFTAALVLSLVSFAVDSFRLAIHPSLEKSRVGNYQNKLRSSAIDKFSSSNLESLESKSSAQRPPRAMEANDMQLEEIMITASKRTTPQNMYQLSDSDRVQTGPGLPTWKWNAVTLRSSGPVAQEQTLSFIYSAPWLTSLWRIMAVFLLGIYTALVIKRLFSLINMKTLKPNALPAGTNIALVCLLLLSGIIQSPTTIADDYPPKYLLQELENKLTQAPTCLPHCASLNNGQLNIVGSTLTISFDVYADTNIALPLPQGHSHWQIVNVVANDKKVPLSKNANQVLIQLKQGHHRVKLTATLSEDQAAISFPVPIHNFRVSAEHWQVDGLVDGRIRNNTLNLRAIDKNQGQKIDTLKPDPVPAFVSVTRSFSFEKQWRVTTTLTRIAPKQGAISVSIPLLPHEKLLSDIGEIKDAMINLQLGHQQQRLLWHSSMDPTSHLNLEAARGKHYIEQWQFTPSSLWRLHYQGIPPIKRDTETNNLKPSFKPWPGEKLNVTISRPEGIPGATHTVEKASLEFVAGKQIQKSKLSLNIRASLGEDYSITLPIEAEVLKVSNNGRQLNLPADNQVKIALQPGSQEIIIEFQEFKKIGLLNKSAAITLPDRATNISVSYRLPHDRWPLSLKGPSIGPAMLYWGVLCVIILGAITLPYLASALKLNMPITLTGWLLLGIGLSTVNGYGVLITAGFFFLLAYRKQHINPDTLSNTAFNLLQLFIICWAILAAISIVSAIPLGLLSNPKMQVLGNGSSSHLYRYYQDMVDTGQFPTVSVISVPLFVYRIVMLLWSLWLASKIIQWSTWGWQCYSNKTAWKHKIKQSKEQ